MVPGTNLVALLLTISYLLNVFFAVESNAFVFSDERRLDAPMKRVFPEECHAMRKYYDPVIMSCSPCPLNVTTVSVDCYSCPAGLVRTRTQTNSGHQEECSLCSGRVVNGICSPVNEVAGSSSSNVVALNGFRGSVLGCQLNGNATACQHVANLCVKELIASAAVPSAGVKLSACEEYERLIKVASTSTSILGLPLIVYPNSRSTSRVLSASDVIDERYTNVGSGSTLRLLAASFAENGQFLGLETLGSALRRTCPGLGRRLFRYGVTYSVNCHFEKPSWNATTPSLFVDIYLAYRNQDGIEMLLPLPSRTIGKRNPDEGDDVRLFRRLPVAVFTAASGRQLYPSRVELAVTRRRSNDDRPGFIHPPFLSVLYREVEEGDGVCEGCWQEPFLTMRVSVRFVTDLSDVYRDMGIAVGVLSVVACALGFVRTWIWARRRGSSVAVDTSVAVHLLVYSLSAVANAAFLVFSVVSVAWFVVFRLQAEPLVFLPCAGEDERFFVVFFILAFVFKALEMALLVYDQTVVGLFFLDWERPVAVGDNVGTVKGGDGNVEGGTKGALVSIWRSYALAERWLSLQTHRRVSCGLSIFATVVFLESLRWKSATSTAPDATELTSSLPGVSVPESYVSRVALIILCFTMMWTLQWLLYKFLYERYVNNLLSQFVDLCSLANVSLFVFAGGNFGYYIHGRSPGGRADVDLRSMHLQLEREKRDHCSSRGLLPNSDSQVFSFSLPSKFSASMAKVRMAARAGLATTGGRRQSQLQTRQNQMTRRTSGSSADQRMGEAAAGMGFLGEDVEAICQEHSAMARFLSAFIDHNLKDLDYKVTKRLFIESLVNAEFQEPGADRAVFFKERSEASFAEVLFYGSEFTLGSFELASFVFFDTVLNGDFVLAGFFAYATWVAIAYLRRKLACVNIGKRGLLDPRLLS